MGAAGRGGGVKPGLVLLRAVLCPGGGCVGAWELWGFVLLRPPWFQGFFYLGLVQINV